mmetsp:Transcript_32736/g.76111  ORF Transcript_32736/g.76111 Transcript_32736/m.76111 type:complete len:361 (+) Transcript_32736:48-1130(+)|eukprot:CAMPEP_0171090106 /NCGR_PEP_ID=MMETSP0766_2-20121228/28945_1 /TAXON_ID=439317 /ORGANISM="Gambierdiscus australes, Strain CAWD 149" /LENGTH=360 /DNA_ID=CAMNT_0011548061 /DNA_START=38 /DNA_END=1120 /DNA_ORIENTATION=-
MAPRSGKRTAKAAAPAPEPKKRKADPLVKGLLDAICQADLSEGCRSMLVAAVPWCFSLDAEGKRHALQALVESWVSEVIDGVQERMTEAIKAMDSEVANAETRRREREENVPKAQAALAAVEEQAFCRSASANEAAKGVAAARECLAEANKTREKGEQTLAKANKDRQRLDKVLEEHLQPLKDPSLFKPSDAKRHAIALKPIAKELALDDSLQTALQSACFKAPGERGDFDRVVFDELETNMARRVDELGAIVERNNVTACDSAAAVAKAEKDLKAAEEAEKAALSELDSAKSKVEEARTAVSEAKAAVDNFDAELIATKVAREEKAACLENFKGYNVSCLEMLREQVKPPEGKAEQPAA